MDCVGRNVLRREFNFADMHFFCILRELIFAIVKDWFFELDVNFCNFQIILFI